MGATAPPPGGVVEKSVLTRSLTPTPPLTPPPESGPEPVFSGTDSDEDFTTEEGDEDLTTEEAAPAMAEQKDEATLAMMTVKVPCAVERTPSLSSCPPPSSLPLYVI